MLCCISCCAATPGMLPLSSRLDDTLEGLSVKSVKCMTCGAWPERCGISCIFHVSCENNNTGRQSVLGVAKRSVSLKECWELVRASRESAWCILFKCCVFSAYMKTIERERGISSQLYNWMNSTEMCLPHLTQPLWMCLLVESLWNWSQISHEILVDCLTGELQYIQYVLPMI